MSSSEPVIPVLDLAPEIAAHWSEVLAAIEGVIRSNRFVLGPEVGLFEEELASFVGVKHAVGVNSGTDALIISLRALGVTVGDEVITTPFSFVAAAEAICLTGATPIFADIDPSTFNLDPSAVEKKISPRTKAIIPVHLYGCPAEMSAITKIAKRHNLWIIEDCAQAFGAKLMDGRQVGSKGELAAFSFYPTKNLGSYGDAGIIVTPHDSLKDKLRMLRVHGEKTRYDSSFLGYNSRLDSIQAAVLRVKLKYIEDKNRARCQGALLYQDLLAGISEIQLPKCVEGHVFHQYTIRVKGGRRDELREGLMQNGIHSIVYYPTPIDLLPPYRGAGSPCRESFIASQEVLSLPLWPTIDPKTQEKVASQVKKVLSTSRR